MTQIDREFFTWEREMYGNGPYPEYRIVKELYAEHLANTKTKNQIWKMLCGPATGPCKCNCMCPAGIAWNHILAMSEQEAVKSEEREL